MNRPTNKQLGWGIVAVAAILATLFFGVNFPVPPAPEEPAMDLESRSLSRPVQFRDVKILQNLDVDGDVAVGAGYVLENPVASQVIEFGETGAMASKAITPVAISTVTASGCTVNSPSAAAQLCYSVRSGNIITFTIYNSAVTPVAITTPHATGASYWIGGTD